MNVLSSLSKAKAWADEFPPTLTFNSREDSSYPNGMHVIAECIAGRDYSLGKFYTQADADARPEFAEHISWLLAERNVERAFAPSVGAMSGYVANQNELSVRILLPYGNELWRNKELPCDGVPLLPGEAFVMSGGGCPVLIVNDDTVCIVSHTSRDSALDPEYILGNPSKRKHISVVGTTHLKCKEMGADPSNMIARCLFPIPQRSFGHPCQTGRDANLNRWRSQYIGVHYGDRIAHVKRGRSYIDMYELVMAQARELGFVLDHKGQRPLPSAGEFGHTRHRLKRMKSQRNLVIVRRLS